MKRLENKDFSQLPKVFGIVRNDDVVRRLLLFEDLRYTAVRHSVNVIPTEVFTGPAPPVVLTRNFVRQQKFKLAEDEISGFIIFFHIWGGDMPMAVFTAVLQVLDSGKVSRSTWLLRATLLSVGS